MLLCLNLSGSPLLVLGVAGFKALPFRGQSALAETGTCGLLGVTLGSAADRDEANVARRLRHRPAAMGSCRRF